VYALPLCAHVLSHWGISLSPRLLPAIVTAYTLGGLHTTENVSDLGNEFTKKRMAQN